MSDIKLWNQLPSLPRTETAGGIALEMPRPTSQIPFSNMRASIPRFSFENDWIRFPSKTP
jgi:hypothetical protein